MNSKRFFYSELAYIFGLIILAFGTAFMEKADFGMSMVVAPAYLLHLKISEYLPFFSFGMAEYSFQLFLLIIIMIVMRKFKPMFLFSFVTAVLYGFILDGSMFLISFIPCNVFLVRILFFLLGMVLCSVGVSLLFHTYIAPEAYELFVKEISSKYKKDIHKVKTIYDIISCIVAIILSFSFFGFLHFEGVKTGTVFCALINGFLISLCTKVFDHLFTFKDGLNLRRFFN